jgi:hypothetical protein
MGFDVNPTIAVDEVPSVAALAEQGEYGVEVLGRVDGDARRDLEVELRHRGVPIELDTGQLRGPGDELGDAPRRVVAKVLGLVHRVSSERLQLLPEHFRVGARQRYLCKCISDSDVEINNESIVSGFGVSDVLRINTILVDSDKMFSGSFFVVEE